MSKDGYKSGSKDRNKSFNIIPSGRITMKDVPHPVLGMDNLGNKQLMMPGGEYQFPGHSVHEVPLKGNNMKLRRMKDGGAAEGHPNHFWDGEKWVSSIGGATYNNGVFYATGGNYSQNGGPTFPPPGAGAIFAMGGKTASFYVDGNGYPRPFAMDPGTGRGSGYLEDLPTHMQMGGIPGAQQVNPFAMNPGSGMGSGMLEDYSTEFMKKGGKHKPKMTRQQMQMMMQSMQGQQAPPMGSQPPMGPGMMPQSPQGQMMPPQGGQMMPPQPGMMPPGMASGGIHIKKSHEGRFTAYKERTGKTTEEALHSKDPHVRQMANFAHNAAKWHHEYGGPAMQMGGEITAGGNVIRDSEGRVFAMGGRVNPYHPLAKFMQDGGIKPDWGDTPEAPAQMPDAQPNPGPAPDTAPAPSGVVPDPADNAQWRDGMNDQQAQDNLNGDGDTTDTQNGSQGSARQRNGYGWGIAGAGLAALGAGLGIASSFANKRDERNLRNKQFNDRSTVNQNSVMNQPGGMGDYDQYGSFRPNQNTPARAGYFPPNMAPTGRYGGTFATGGMYQAGGEYEMDDAEIARLKKMGYKVDLM